MSVMREHTPPSGGGLGGGSRRSSRPTRWRWSSTVTGRSRRWRGVSGSGRRIWGAGFAGPASIGARSRGSRVLSAPGWRGCAGRTRGWVWGVSCSSERRPPGSRSRGSDPLSVGRCPEGRRAPGNDGAPCRAGGPPGVLRLVWPLQHPAAPLQPCLPDPDRMGGPPPADTRTRPAASTTCQPNGGKLRALGITYGATPGDRVPHRIRWASSRLGWGFRCLGGRAGVSRGRR